MNLYNSSFLFVLVVAAAAFMIHIFHYMYCSSSSSSSKDNYAANYNEYTSKDPYMFLRLDISSAPISPPIPSDFASFSLEWYNAPILSNSPTFRTLLQNLYDYHSNNNKGPNLRIGGGSADGTWWYTQDKSQADACSAAYDPHICIKNNVTSDTLLSLYHMARELDATLTLDLNMLQNRTATWAVEELQGILETLSNFSDFSQRIESIEIGNEPDLFGEHGERDPNYSPDDYRREWDMYLEQLSQVRNLTNFLQGGTFCCERPFLDQQIPMMDTYAQYLYSWSFHHYPTTACGNSKPSIPDLLSDAASDGQGKFIKKWVQHATQQVGIPFHLGETNSMTCSGITGVSDTMASALWALDYMFTLAVTNVSRANFHGGGRAPYSWFFIDSTTDIPTVNPLYYSMWIWRLITTTRSNSKDDHKYQVVPLDCLGGIGCQDDPPPTPRWCQEGILWKNICCAKRCGVCAGTNCSHRPGGAKRCCETAIVRHCQNATDVGCLLPKDKEPIRVKAWATTTTTTTTSDDKEHTHVLILNKLLVDHHKEPIVVQLKLPFSIGYMATLAGPPELGMSAQRNLSFAGVTWEGSQKGESKGNLHFDRILPIQTYYHHGNGNHYHLFEISVEPATAVLVSSFDLSATSTSTSTTSTIMDKEQEDVQYS